MAWNKKDPQKKKNQKKVPKIPGLPEDSKVKVIQITPKTFLYPILFFLVLWMIYTTWIGRTGETVTYNETIGLNQIATNYHNHIYEEIVVAGTKIDAKKPAVQNVVNGVVTDSREVDRIKLPAGTNIADLDLFDPIDNPTKITIKDVSFAEAAYGMIPGILGTVLMVVLFVWLLSRLAWGGWPMGGAMSFIRSRAKVYDPEGKDKVTFADVAGSDEEKEDLVEVVDFLKNPEKYKKLWAKIPRGILLQGPPGTGKTLLARAVAGESNVPFFSISGSEFVEMFVGVGASRVRDLFAEAREKAPAIIFIDEVDAIGKKRSPWIGGGHDEREQTLNQILTEMDGFDNDTNVIVMAATNRADVLDKALLRPGRFDRKVTINLPTLEDREKILQVHAKNKPFASDIDWKKIAGITVGFSGAELWNLLNESAILAGKKNQDTITEDLIQVSIEKVIMGNEKKSLKMSEHEKRLTALHEVWHAIVGKMLPHTDSVHKISILPRGWAGWVTWFLPEKDRTYTSKAKYLDELATLYGGRVAEEVFFGENYITTGASNDIERATSIARAMVMRFGFDKEIGAENYAPDNVDGNFLWAEAQEKAISDDTRKIIDEKVKKYLSDAYATAKRIITENKNLHEDIAHALFEKEEMLKEEFDAFFEGNGAVPKKIAM